MTQIAKYDNLSYYTDDDSFVWHINNGKSEPYTRELEIVKKYLKKYPTLNNTFIDVGGHIGTTSLPYSRLFKNGISFEPNKKSFNYFLQNLKINNINNVTLYNQGVYNKTTTCNVIKHAGGNSGCFYIQECDKNDINAIEVIKLDDLCINNINIDFIKIDTEGSELYVLEGSIDLINKYKPLIQVETNECSDKYFGYNKDKIFDFMKHNGYKVFDDNGSNPFFYFTPSHI